MGGLRDGRCRLADDRARARRDQRALCPHADARVTAAVPGRPGVTSEAGIEGRRLANGNGDPHIFAMGSDGPTARIGAAEEAACLAVLRLALTDFRCYRQARVAVDVRP